MSSKILIGIVSIIMLVLLAGCNDENVEDYRMMDETKWDTYSDTWHAWMSLAARYQDTRWEMKRRQVCMHILPSVAPQHLLFKWCRRLGQQTSDVTRILEKILLPFLTTTNRLYGGRQPPSIRASPIFGYYDLQYDDYVLKARSDAF